jgi:hypothetical protein
MKRSTYLASALILLVIVTTLFFCKSYFSERKEKVNNVSTLIKEPEFSSELLVNFKNGSNCINSVYTNISLYEDPQLLSIFNQTKKNLESGWELYNICTDPSQEFSYIIVTTRNIRLSQADESTITYTETYFPAFSKNVTPKNGDDGEYREYKFSSISFRDSQLLINNQNIKYTAGVIYPIGHEIIWPSVLAGCRVEPGLFFRNAKIVIACGGGDNGCYEEDRAEISIADSSIRRLGSCKKNCDLVEGQLSELTCNPS